MELIVNRDGGKWFYLPPKRKSWDINGKFNWNHKIKAIHISSSLSSSLESRHPRHSNSLKSFPNYLCADLETNAADSKRFEDWQSIIPKTSYNKEYILLLIAFYSNILPINTSINLELFAVPSKCAILSIWALRCLLLKSASLARRGRETEHPTSQNFNSHFLIPFKFLAITIFNSFNPLSASFPSIAKLIFHTQYLNLHALITWRF